jgi:hypothetical protein
MRSTKSGPIGDRGWIDGVTRCLPSSVGFGSDPLVSLWIDSFVYCDCDQDNHTAHGVLNVRRD